MDEANQSMTSEQKKKSRSHKHKHRHHHSKGSKNDTVPEGAGVVTGAQSILKRGNNETNSQLDGAYHFAEILRYLENLCMEGKPPVSEKDINEHFKIKMSDIKDLMKKLKEHPHINYEGKLFSYRPNIDIVDKNQLIDQLTKLRLVKTSDLKGAYKGFEKDLKQLVEDGIIDQFNSNGDRKDKLYYYYDPKLMKLKAPENFRKLWAEIEVPPSQVDRESKLREFQGEPLKLVDQYKSLDDDVEVGEKRRKKRQSTNSTNQKILKELDESE